MYLIFAAEVTAVVSVRMDPLFGCAIQIFGGQSNKAWWIA